MKLNFKDRIVVFIDVLGFKNLVYGSDQSIIQKYFKYVVSDLKILLSNKKFNYLLISDSIVISGPNTAANLNELIFVLGKMQAALLKMNILVRGAISYGNLHTNKTNNIVVGDGLIKAYNLESCAKYPRILIDRTFIPMFYGNTASFMKETNSTFMEKFDEQGSNVKLNTEQKDNWPYINYIRKLVRHGSTYSPPRYKNIIKFIKSQYYNHENYEKYNWLRNELIEEIELAIKHYTLHSEFKCSKLRVRKLQEWLKKLINM